MTTKAFRDMTGDGVLESLHSAVVARLSATLGEKKARAEADAIVTEIAEAFGGQAVYFQLRSPYISRLIAASFTGDNVPELVARFRMSRATIYKIIQRERQARAQKEKQLRLPGC